MTNPRVMRLDERPEDEDVYGWDGPGWYYAMSHCDIDGPFDSEEQAFAALEQETKDREAYYESLDVPEYDYEGDWTEDDENAP